MQRKAITAVNGATRIQNFQLIQGLRLVRSTTSLFSNLNQVYQTLLLRQISSNQQTVAQRESFERLTEKTSGLVNALDILGPANAEVKDALSSLVLQADSLSSDNIQLLIDRMKAQAEQANFSAEEQKAFNDTIAKLQELLDETKLDEKNKEFQDFFGLFTSLGTAASTLGLFVLQLQKFESIASLFSGGSSARGGLLGIALLLPQILRALGIDPSPQRPVDENGQERGINSVTRRFEEAIKRLEVNINNPTFNSDLDLEKTIDIIKARLLEEEGRVSLE